MTIRIITASAGLALTLLAAAPAAQAQQKTPVLRFGHMNSPTHIVNLGGQRLKAAMEKASGGPVQIDLFPSAQLGENSAVLEQLTLGSNIITQVGPGTIAQYVPNYSVMVHPFLFKNWDEVKKVANSPLVKGWEKGLVKHNIKPLCFFNFGTRDLYTRNKAVRTPADTAGLKIRVQPVAIYTELVKSMGGQATPMPWPEVYSALSQGVIDAAEAPPNAIIDQKHYEAAKFYMKTNHILDAAMVVMSLKAFNALNADQQKTLEAAANEACDWMTAESGKVYDSSVAELQKQGMTIVSDVDRAAFEKAAESIQKAFPDWSPNLVADVRKQLGR
ncbi:TRAP transporter substrate-binding protein [Bosea sp. ANAM02]|uniref:TRAP transporter substrate-binding protein n=1 Tax=Bosea sp. ANAM02 TaxID=2020412 RepID=UPI0006456FD4|nr:MULTISPECIES: TRAP transporter substrate-binding protein [Hyphomicrobiales]BCB18946.1 ABC transporter substrate-binding protein [Bosea sp. ANAM02]